MKTVEISTELAAEPATVWHHVRRPELLNYVSKGVVGFQPLEPATWPDTWSEGEYTAAMKIFGIPSRWQVIGIEFLESDGRTYRLRDNGRGRDIAVWDHMIEVAPAGLGTRYTDRVRVDAGWRTPIIAAFAHFLYSHRQKRWRRLVANGFDYSV